METYNINNGLSDLCLSVTVFFQNIKLITICTLAIHLTVLFELSAQNQEKEELKRGIERIMELQDDENTEIDFQHMLDDMDILLNQLIDINQADSGNLTRIPGMTPRLAQNIIRYRDEHGPFQSVDHLLSVPGIGPVTLENLRPYITADNGHNTSIRRFFRTEFWTDNSRIESFSRFRKVIQDQEGYQRPDSLGGYVGSQSNIYQRIRYTSRHLSMNTTLNKSPGEPYQSPLQLDTGSWHISVNGIGRLQSFVVGDFSVGFGQGLLLWNGGSFGKSSQVIRGVSRNERGIRPISSAQAATGFRGIGIEMNLTKRMFLSGFYSDKKRSATFVDAETVNLPASAPRYRTSNEINRRNNLSQNTIGGRISIKGSYGVVGISAYRNRFDKKIAAGTNSYQLYHFSGRELRGGSTDLRLYIGDTIYLFGEFALSDNSATALISGAELIFSDRTRFVLAYRDYGKSYQATFGSGFGEQSGAPRNERGIYLGLKHQLTADIRLLLYMDQFHFPSARFQSRQPSTGHDWLAQLEYRPTRNVNLTLLTRFKQRETENSYRDEYGRDTRILDFHKRLLTRFQLEYRVSPKLRLRFRSDYVHVKPPMSATTTGTLMFADIRAQVYSRLRVDLRLTMFDTDDFESRVFQFENDLLFVMTNTMLYDKGQRVYLLLYTNISDHFDIWFKFSTTLYENRMVIGSGLDQIVGNRRSDIGIQVRIRI